MDSSNKPDNPITVEIFDLVMGKAKVGIQEITPEIWLKIIKMILSYCRGYLEYLPTKPLPEIFQAQYPDLVIPPEVINFAKDLNIKTRGLGVSGFFFRKIPKKYGGHQEEKCLFITQKGRFVVGHIKYRECRATSAEFCRFRYLKNGELLSILSSEYGRIGMMGHQIISSLLTSFQDKELKLKKALENIQRLVLRLDAIESTIITGRSTL